MNKKNIEAGSKVPLKARQHSRGHLILSEVLNSITHGSGFGLSIAGLVILIIAAVKTGETIRIVSYTIYGSCMILLYLCSTLYHSLTFTKAKRIMQIFDHSAIYIFIAGTYTPYCLVTIGGAFGWTLFGIIWGLAVTGVVLKPIMINKGDKVAVIIYILMGWLCIIGIKPLYLGLGNVGFGLLLGGGISFSLGAVVFLFDYIKFMHAVWHLFVLLGTILMYFSILLYA